MNKFSYGRCAFLALNNNGEAKRIVEGVSVGIRDYANICGVGRAEGRCWVGAGGGGGAVVKGWYNGGEVDIALRLGFSLALVDHVPGSVVLGHILGAHKTGKVGRGSVVLGVVAGHGVARHRGSGHMVRKNSLGGKNSMVREDSLMTVHARDVKRSLGISVTLVHNMPGTVVLGNVLGADSGVVNGHRRELVGAVVAREGMAGECDGCGGNDTNGRSVAQGRTKADRIGRGVDWGVDR